MIGFRGLGDGRVLGETWCHTVAPFRAQRVLHIPLTMVWLQGIFYIKFASVLSEPMKTTCIIVNNDNDVKFVDNGIPHGLCSIITWLQYSTSLSSQSVTK